MPWRDAPPNAHLLAEAPGLRPGLAVDAGAGDGAETLGSRREDGRVTAVDFSASALGHARASAERLGADAAERIDWIEADLATGAPPPDRYDLVICLYVHVAGPVDELVRRLAAGVGPGGTLLLVGHRPVDPATGAPTPAAGQVQVSVEEAVAALHPARWEILIAEERPRQAAETGIDAVVRATARAT